MSVPPQSERDLPSPAESEDSWISLDDIILQAPVAFAQTRAGLAVNDEQESCYCCCCCCCCKPAEEEPPPTMTEPLTVGMSTVWELLLDPTSITAGANLRPRLAVRGQLRWRARGSREVRVDIEARSEGRDGRAQGRFPSWTPILSDQSPVDLGTLVIDRSLGEVVHLRARATDSDGNVAYSKIISVTPGWSRR